jgi:hypothetical protein
MKITRAEARRADLSISSGARSLEQLGMLRVVDLKDSMCSADRCIVESDGNLLYRDNNHLNDNGAQFVTPSLEPCFTGLPTSRPP